MITTKFFCIIRVRLQI